MIKMQFYCFYLQLKVSLYNFYVFAYHRNVKKITFFSYSDKNVLELDRGGACMILH